MCRVVDVPAEPLFRALADWGGWASWLPGIKGCVLESGGPATVGSVRIVTAPTGDEVRERMTACDEVELAVSYTIDGPAPFPARHYAAHVRLFPLTDSSATVVDWTAFFDADAEVEDQLRLALEGYFEVFIDAVAAAVA